MIFSDPPIAVTVLICVIGTYLLVNAANVLNIKALQSHLPKGFCDIYDRQQYEKSQTYLKANTRLEIFSSSLEVLYLLIFWFSGGFGILDRMVRGLGDPPVLQGVLFIGVLLALKFIVFLPFSIYRTFVIEERFGFNKITPRIFFLDLIKTAVLTVVLGGLLLAAILWFFNACGPWAWVYCWGVTTLFMIGIQYIVPTWIMPLFNTFTPLEPGPLRTAIFNYARTINFPLAQIFVMDGSRRSTKSNAFFTGFGKNRRIVLYDTLIREHNTEELLAVLAHEMGHFKKKHIQRRLVMGIFQTGILFYLVSLFIRWQGLFRTFYVDQPSVYAGLVFFSILFSPIDLIMSLVLNFFSRQDERQADRFAAETTNDPSALVSALKKLSAHNLSNLTPHPFFVWLNYSHPPVKERIRYLLQPQPSKG